MRKQIALLFCLLGGISIIPLSVQAVDKPEVISAASNEELSAGAWLGTSDYDWENDLDNIMITIVTNQDVDQLVLSSGQGDILLTPLTNYSEEDIRGNNQVMDMNGDLEVTEEDYEILKKHIEGNEDEADDACNLYTNTIRCAHCGAADIDGDGDIDYDDLQMVEDHLNGECTLDDCYFHGTRTYREEDGDNYIWSFHYTPTIEGIDTMSVTPQAVTSTDVRNGEVFTIDIHAEEYKNPVVLSVKKSPNRYKYYIDELFNVTVVTPIECDMIMVSESTYYDPRDKEEIGEEFHNFCDDISIDYENNEKTWVVPYSYPERLAFNLMIVGFAKQSDGYSLNSIFETYIPVRFIDPQVINCETTITHTRTVHWTTNDGEPDEDGNPTEVPHSKTYYTHTCKAVTNSDVDYVIFETPEGTVTDNTFSNAGDGEDHRVFSTSWEDTNLLGEATAQPKAVITTLPD